MLYWGDPDRDRRNPSLPAGTYENPVPGMWGSYDTKDGAQPYQGTLRPAIVKNESPYLKGTRLDASSTQQTGGPALSWADDQGAIVAGSGPHNVNEAWGYSSTPDKALVNIDATGKVTPTTGDPASTYIALSQWSQFDSVKDGGSTVSPRYSCTPADGSGLCRAMPGYYSMILDFSSSIFNEGTISFWIDGFSYWGFEASTRNAKEAAMYDWYRNPNNSQRDKVVVVNNGSTVTANSLSGVETTADGGVQAVAGGAATTDYPEGAPSNGSIIGRAQFTIQNPGKVEIRLYNSFVATHYSNFNHPDNTVVISPVKWVLTCP